METKTTFALALLTLGLVLTSVPVATAATKTWSGWGANNNMGTATNWYETLAPVAGDDLVFGSTSSRPSPVHQMSISNFNSITFTNGGFSLEALTNGTRFVLAVGINNRAEASNATNTIRVAIYLTNALTIINNATPSLYFDPDSTYTNVATTNLAIDNQGHLLIFAGSGNITFGSTPETRGAYIRGGGGLAKYGAGTLTLNGTNTYLAGNVCFRDLGRGNGGADSAGPSVFLENSPRRGKIPG